MQLPSAKNLAMGFAAGIAGGGLTAIGAGLGITTFDATWPVATACTVIGALLHNTKEATCALVDNRTQTIRNRLERMRRDVCDIHGLVRLGPYTQSLPLPIGGGWALTGDSAALLAREVLTRKPEAILELGSGVSTLILGQILKRTGRGRVLSVDHDADWANQTRRYVEFLGLDDVISVIDAPLRAQQIEGCTYNWYDIPQCDLDTLGTIDFLLVDGPPQREGDSLAARYPALPVLRQRLSQNALIFVDDANRSAESRMLKTWLEDEPDWCAQRFDTVDGVCILTRKT